MQTHRVRAVVVHFLEESRVELFVPFFPADMDDRRPRGLVPPESPRVVRSMAIQLVPVRATERQIFRLRRDPPGAVMTRSVLLFCSMTFVPLVRVVGERVFAEFCVVAMMVSTARKKYVVLLKNELIIQGVSPQHIASVPTLLFKIQNNVLYKNMLRF